MNVMNTIKRKFISVLLAIAMMAPMFAGIPAVAAVALNPWIPTSWTETGIDYSAPDIIVTGTVNDVPDNGFTINLSRETFSFPAWFGAIAAYSTDGGNRWRAVGANSQFTYTNLANLFTQNVTLAFTNQFNTQRRIVPAGATVVTFPMINRRPTLMNLSVNYRIGADHTAMTTGTWVLTEIRGRLSVTERIEVGAANSDGRLDERGFGRFFGGNGSTNGIPIRELPYDSEDRMFTYFIRQAPSANSDGTFTAASSARSIEVRGQRAAPAAVRLNRSERTISHGANTYVWMDGALTFHAQAGAIDISGFTGDAFVWGAGLEDAPMTAIYHFGIQSADNGSVAIYDTAIYNTLAAAFYGIMPLGGMGFAPFGFSVQDITITSFPAPFELAASPAAIVDRTGHIWLNGFDPASHTVIVTGYNPNYLSVTIATPNRLDVVALATQTVIQTLIIQVSEIGPGPYTFVSNFTVVVRGPVGPPPPLAPILVVPPHRAITVNRGNIDTATFTHVIQDGGPVTGVPAVVWRVEVVTDPTGATSTTLPPGLSFSNGVFSWDSSLLDPGQYTVGFIVEYSGVSATEMARTRGRGTFVLNVVDMVNIAFRVHVSSLEGGSVTQIHPPGGATVTGGTIGDASVPAGVRPEFHATPNPKWEVAEWMLIIHEENPDGSWGTIVETIFFPGIPTYSMSGADMQNITPGHVGVVHVRFRRVPYYTVNFNLVPEGGQVLNATGVPPVTNESFATVTIPTNVNGNGFMEVLPNRSLRFDVIPEPGWEVDTWSVHRLIMGQPGLVDITTHTTITESGDLRRTLNISPEAFPSVPLDAGVGPTPGVWIPPVAWNLPQGWGVGDPPPGWFFNVATPTNSSPPPPGWGHPQWVGGVWVAPTATNTQIGWTQPAAWNLPATPTAWTVGDPPPSWSNWDGVTSPPPPIPVGWRFYPTEGVWGNIIVNVTFTRTAFYTINFGVGNEGVGGRLAVQGPYGEVVTATGSSLREIVYPIWAGQPVVFDARPDADYRVRYWSIRVSGGLDIGSITTIPPSTPTGLEIVLSRHDMRNPNTLTIADLPGISSNTTIIVTVIFEPTPFYDIYVRTLPIINPVPLPFRGGTVAMDGGPQPPTPSEFEVHQRVAPGQHIIFIANPAPGFRVREWTIDGTVIAATPGDIPFWVPSPPGATPTTIIPGPVTEISLGNLPPIPGDDHMPINVTVQFEPLPAQITSPAPPDHRIRAPFVDHPYHNPASPPTVPPIQGRGHQFTAEYAIAIATITWRLEVASGTGLATTWHEHTVANDNFPLSFNTDTGLLFGTPEKGQGGTYRIRVTALVDYGIPGHIPERNSIPREYIIRIYDLLDIDFAIEASDIDNGTFRVEIRFQAEDMEEHVYNFLLNQNNPGALQRISNVPEGAEVRFIAQPRTDEFITIWRDNIRDAAGNYIQGGTLSIDRTTFTIHALRDSLILGDEVDNSIVVGFVRIMPRQVWHFVRPNPPVGGNERGTITASPSSFQNSDQVGLGNPVYLTVAETDPNFVFAGWEVWNIGERTVANQAEFDNLITTGAISSATDMTAISTFVNPVRLEILQGNTVVIAVFNPRVPLTVTGIELTDSEGRPANTMTIGADNSDILIATVFPPIISVDSRVIWTIGSVTNIPGFERDSLATNPYWNPAEWTVRQIDAGGGQPGPWITIASVVGFPDPTEDLRHNQRMAIVSVSADADPGWQFNVTATSVANPSVSATSLITVGRRIYVRGITISGPPRMNVRQTDVVFTAIVQPFVPGIPSESANQRVTWESSDPSVATIDPITGAVTAHRVGTTTIIATTVGTTSTGERLSASAELEVVLATIILIPPEVDFGQALTSDYDSNGFTREVIVRNIGTDDTGPITITFVPGSIHFEILDINAPPLPNGTPSQMDPGRWAQSTVLPSLPPGGESIFTIRPREGLPERRQPYTGTAVVRGANGGEARLPMMFMVGEMADDMGPPRDMQPETLPNGLVGIAYPPVVFTVNGLRPVTWEWRRAMPDADEDESPIPGLMLCPITGVLSGTPTREGVFTIIVTARNALGYISRTYVVRINRPPVIILPWEVNDNVANAQIPGGALLQAHLHNAVVGTPYNQTLLTRGFVDDNSVEPPPLYWRIISGSLPPGLNLTQWIDGRPIANVSPPGATNRAGAVIEGTPTAAGTGLLYTFIVEAREIVYFRQTGTAPAHTVEWRREGFDIVHATNNPNRYERVTWTAGGFTTTVVIDVTRRATRTMNIQVGTTPYFPTSGITITTPPHLSVAVGATIGLSANVLPAGATNRHVTWESSNHGVATVNAQGMVTAHSPGIVRITATTADRRWSAFMDLTVTSVAVTGMTVTPTSLTVAPGYTSQLTPNILPANASNRNVTWVSSNPSVAMVSATGVVTGVREGTATITARTVEGNFTQNVAVTVSGTAVTRITLSATALRVAGGATAQLTAHLTPANAVNRDLIWSTSDAGVALVSDTGLVTGAATGTAVITVRLAANPAMIYATAHVTVTPTLVTGVTLDRSTLSMAVNDTTTLTATLVPSGTVAGRNSVTWISTNQGVARVNEYGEIEALAPGTAEIIVTTVDGGRRAVAQVTVLYQEFNVNVRQTPGGTASASVARAARGARVTLYAVPDPGFYFVAWETTHFDFIAQGENFAQNLAISLNRFIMPENHVNITPIFKRLTLLSEYIPPRNLDVTQQSHTLRFTNVVHNSLGISILGSELAELTLINPDFTIDFHMYYTSLDFGRGLPVIYQIPVNFFGLVPGLSQLLDDHHLTVDDVAFNIIMTDMSINGRCGAIRDAVGRHMPGYYDDIIMAHPIFFSIEVAKLTADGRPGARIAVLDEFAENALTKLIPLVPDADPNAASITDMRWGAFRYNEVADQFEFVPHIAETLTWIDNRWFLRVMSNRTNNIYIAAQNLVNFSDVLNIPDNQWFRPYVNRAAAKTLIRGLGGGLYQPHRNVTRAEFVQMMANALQLPAAAAGTPVYADVAPTAWFYNAIMRARSAGLLVSPAFEGENFNPNQHITRGEMTAILGAVLRREGFAADSMTINNFFGSFTDAGTISVANLPNAALVSSLGIIRGVPVWINGVEMQSFSPNGYATRAQAAIVLIRLLEVIGFIDALEEKFTPVFMPIGTAGFTD